MQRLWLCLIAGMLCLAQQGANSGIDRGSLDTTCKPCEDFWRYANGGYIDRNPIPAQYSRWGTVQILRDANSERMKVLLETAAANTSATGNERAVGQFYASCVNTAAIDAAGMKPVEGLLRRINAIRARQDLIGVLLSFELPGNVNPARIDAQPDPDDASLTITGVGAGGLSLPERDYYFRDDDRSKKIREEFTAHVARMLALAGDRAESTRSEAAAVLEFETVLARATLTAVERRDPYATRHKVSADGLRALAPGYDWAAAFGELKIPAGGPINVEQPEFMKAFDKQLKEAPVETWKTWLRWRIVNSRAQYLSSSFRNERFHFRQEILTGVKQQQPRWQECVAEADARFGDALGKLFVDKHFPPEAKRRMTELVENLRASLHDELEHSAWMEPETRQNSIRKLNSFEALIGYPDKWRDYSGVRVNGTDFAANAEAASIGNRQFNLARIGQPVDRKEMRMTPPTVNASYSSARNILTFPAGILQPPFFSQDADDAVNYGAIGSVIGHEMGHGFDDEGSQFDADGNLKNWWTDKDRKQFEARAACVTNQFDSITMGNDAANGIRHKGKLVTGEAMGDLGGLRLAYDAYHRSLKGKEAPVIDGFTGDQRFFLAFARGWAEQARPEQERLWTNTDPHPLSRYRANATLQNMPEFHRAFGCKQGEPMVRPAAEQCSLW